jgi:hypothetical protein
VAQGLSSSPSTAKQEKEKEKTLCDTHIAQIFSDVNPEDMMVAPRTLLKEPLPFEIHLKYIGMESVIMGVLQENPEPHGGRGWEFSTVQEYMTV